MKNIQFYQSPNYSNDRYEQIEEMIYKNNNNFVTSLSFEQEEEFGEGKNAEDISQFPVEDILDKYGVYISNFYEKINKKKSKICYLVSTQQLSNPDF